MKKSLTELSVLEVSAYPVWKFTNNPEIELEIETVCRDTYSDLRGLVIGSKVTFSDGSVHWALFQNVSLAGQKVNDHFLVLTIEHNGEWFCLARYHDVAFERHSPSALATFMGKKVDRIFPIQFDLRTVLHSQSPNLVGFVRKEPISRLTLDERISLALLKHSSVSQERRRREN